MKCWGAFVALSLVACSTDVRPSPTETSEQTTKALKEAREEVESWSEECEQGISKGSCDDGDLTLFNGMSCLSGKTSACRAVKMSQGSDGRLWRNPSRVGKEAPDSSSRDMMRGGLAYLIASRDIEFGNRWSRSIVEMRGLCLTMTNNRCLLTPAAHALYNRVAEHVGFANIPSSVVRMWPKASELVQAQIQLQAPDWEDLTLLAEARTSPKGYPQHLVGVSLLLRNRMGQWNGTLQLAAQTLAQRNPANPFFAHLARESNDVVANKLLSQIPKKKPARPFQWSFEREDGESAWKDSMGHEFVFMIDLMGIPK